MLKTLKESWQKGHKLESAIVAIMIISTIAFFINLIYTNANLIYTNANILETEESLITKQIAIEEDLVIQGYTLDNPNVILNPYGNSPLTALVMFQTEEEETPQIVVKGRDTLSTIEGSSKPAKNHYVPIYGLYPGEENQVTITIGQTQKTLMIKTEDLPEDFALVAGMYIPDRGNLTDELYFFTPSSQGYTSAYDVNGDVRWYLTDNMVWDISRLENGRLLLSTERPINPPYFTTGLYEVDLLGKIYTEYSLPGGYHHDFFELENGNLLVASSDFNNRYGTVEDFIVEVDRVNGDIIKTWDLKDVLKMQDGKSENWVEHDWFHNNSVWYDSKEDIIVLSGRHQDAVIAIDYESGDLQWIIGDPNGWSEEYQEYFFTPVDKNGNIIEELNGDLFEWQWSQHAAKITPEGYVSILDNGNNKSKFKEKYVPAEDSYTRGVLYDIDTDNMTIEQIWQYGKERGHEFYSPYISDFDYLGENHYLVHSGGIVYVDGEISNRPAGFDTNVDLYSTTVEILDGEVIFELTLPTNMYRAEKMNMYEGNYFELGEQSRLGSLGTTLIDNESYGVPGKIIEPDKEYETYNVRFTNEEDRLIVSGTFDKDEDISIILYEGFKKIEYEIRVSKVPYTALCIDVFTTEETNDTLEVYKFINKEGLVGNKAIYLKVGDKLYNTDISIKF